MKRLVEVYRTDGKWPWVLSCDRCLVELRHATFPIAINRAHAHAVRHETAGLRSLTEWGRK